MSRRFSSLGLVAVLTFCVTASAGEKVIYEKRSPYNAIAVLENEDGVRTLSFGKDDVQSVVKVGDPDYIECEYIRGMAVGLAFVEEPQRVLVVGLGGGTIPSFLRKHYPRMLIDVVEIDPEVVAVAKKFFGFREDAAMHAYVNDGRRYIEECRKPYDIIFLDAFGSDDIPYELTTREFLQAVRRALTAKGIAVANVFNGDSNRLYHSMVRTYQEVFEGLHVLDVEDTENAILIAMPREWTVSQNDLARRARRISTEKHFRFDMGDLVTYGYNYAGKKDSLGCVLRDKKK